ncbi:hypothetical protein AUK14_00710 [Candidatus Berkelbacteria bacterium CG2_30_39_44]|nr:MAG: hypothetical protein AUK14_00710 [Candidatus Berkelbacteria bacterium CG2_30_39_44]
MKIFIGADHRGIAQITNHKSQITKWGHEIEDLGTRNAEPVDYPLIAEKVARAVVADPQSLGILICGSGQGMCVAANKIKGVRAGVGINPEAIRAGREDDHINILCLSASFIDKKINLEIVKAFLDAQPKTDERYLRRLNQIQRMENES